MLLDVLLTGGRATIPVERLLAQLLAVIDWEGGDCVGMVQDTAKACLEGGPGHRSLVSGQFDHTLANSHVALVQAISLGRQR